jgi:amino acid adenylation domain-containing protein/non-ribosomal peptide synthase protein (TIGR01720 family)
VSDRRATPKVLDLYELSPMQEGILFHTLHSTVDNAYFEQRHCLIEGNLQVDAFQKSWQSAIDRHGMLRTAFYWQEAEKPLQVVYDGAELPWTRLDWRDLSEEDRRSAFEDLLKQDRSQGFDLQKPPLMRCYLVHYAAQKWQFVWSHHHLLMDGWCNGILLQQILTDYGALRGAALPVANQSDASYGDYIAWLQAQDKTVAKNYWQTALGVETQGNIWGDRPAPPEAQVLKQQLSCGHELSQALQQFAQQHRLTLSSIFQGAYALMLSQYADRDRVMFGLTVAGRPMEIAGIGQTIGLFINTLPVPVHLVPEMPLLEWLQILQKEQIDRSQYSHSPLTEVQTWANLPGGRLFDSLLVVENYPVTMAQLLAQISSDLQAELEITQPESFSATNYPLVLTVLPGDRIELGVEYQRHCLDDRLVEDILQAMQHYLECFVAKPNQTLCDLAPPPNSDRVKPANFAPIFPLAAFEQQVARQPQKTALVNGAESLSYGALNEQVVKQVAELVSHGVERGDRVAICHGRSIAQIVAILAVLKLGAAYVPIDTMLPKDRIAYLLADSQPLGMLDQSGWQGFGPQSKSLDTAYIIYTSGTTGKPKGVMVDQLSLAYFTAAAIEVYSLHQEDRVLQFSSISFDGAVEEIFPCLAVGGTLVLRSEQVPMAEEFWQLCRVQKVTVIDLPTAYWQQLVRQSQSDQIPDCLRTVIIGGSAIDSETVTIWRSFDKSNITVWNSYGPTETTVVATVGMLDESGSIGLPLPGRTVQILDRWQRPVPSGVTGELYIGGQGLAQGYWNQPELTAQRFVQLGQSRFYRTGDRGYWNENGQIIYQGRRDTQVKLRGFRIELDEVAAAIQQQPEVQQSVVVLDQQTPDQPRLVAYYTGNVEGLTVQTALRQILPSYMIPAQLIALEQMPLTALGKIDRDTLPKAIEATPAGQSRSPVEAGLVEIWQELLGRSSIGIHDNFFDLGGHSLIAMRLVARMQQVMNLEVSFQQLFVTPTIAQLAKLTQGDSTQTEIPRVLRSTLLPVSSAQQRLWILQQLDRESNAYHVSAALKITGDLDLSVLHRSLWQLVERQESLRLCFVAQDGLPYLQVKSAAEVMPLELAIEETPASIQQPFNLAQAPLWRLQVQRASNYHVLHLVMHHSITDGWSIDLLAKEWAAIYQAEITGEPLALPPLSIQYADYASWQRSQTQTQQLTYWQTQLREVPKHLNLPSDRAAALTEGGGRSQRFVIPAVIQQGLQAISQAQNSTLFMTLLTGFGLFLRRISRHLDNENTLVIGTPVANRSNTQVESLIGLFANMLPLRLDFTDGMTFAELLDQVRQTTLQAYVHQDLPFDQMLDGLELDRDLIHNPVFQVAFIFDQFIFGQDPVTVGNLSWQPVVLEQTTAKFDITLMIQQTQAGLQGQWEYRSDLYDSATLDHWSEIFLALLASISVDGSRDINHYHLVPDLDRRQLAEWNQTQQPYDQDGLIPAFHRQVACRPEQIALVCESQQLTYAELDRRSTQLAHLLQTHGVKPQQIVALQLSRSIPAVLTMLAVLKLGAIYLPLDAYSPQERLEKILQESQTDWLMGPDYCALPWSELEGAIEEQSAHPIDIAPAPDQLAYIMYTSGSTGIPKGVAISQRGVLRLVQSCKYAHLDHKQKILHAAPLGFDAATFEVWGALLSGGCLVILPQDEGGLFSIDALLDLVDTQEVTIAWLTAGLLHLLIDEMVDRASWSKIRSLNQLLAGGDALSSRLLLQLKSACPQLRIINGYGPTENTTFTACHEIKLTDLQHSSPPIGKPIQNTQVYVLDPNLQPVPLGIPGELFAAGDGLAQEYWQQPELTQAAFINWQGTRLYRTGDRAKWNLSGNLEYLGRLDRQVKLRGFRIELEEISHVIAQHPAIAQAFVDLNRDSFPTPTLIAYITGSIWNSDIEQDVRQKLQTQLPSYMQPAHWAYLDCLPLTLNGKVDRTRLPLPTLSEVSKQTELPRTDLENSLCQVWESVLRIQPIGIHDNFFALGGDSILAMQMVSRAMGKGLLLNPSQLFQAQTIAELALAIAPHQSQSAQQTVSGDVPLTPIQHWFFAQHFPNPNYFNQSAVLKLTQRLDIKVLQNAWLDVVNRHDMLRSTFTNNDFSWQQTVQPLYGLQEIQDCFHAFQGTEQWTDRINHLQSQLNISRGPLFRLVFFQSSNQCDRLVLIVHHLVIDALSWRILLEDLRSTYERMQLPEEERSQPVWPKVSYRDWSSWMLEASVSHSLDYWRSQTDYEQILPGYNPAGFNRVVDAIDRTISLSVEETQQLLQEVNSAYNTQIQEILVTAIAQGLASWSSRKQVRFDLEAHGREGLALPQIETPTCVGWFTSLFPLTIDLNASSLGQQIITVKETLRNLPQSGLSYGILRYLGSPEIRQSLAEQPVSNICFNYLGQTDIDLSLGFKVLSPQGIYDQDPQMSRPYAIEISAVIREGQLTLSFSFSPDQFIPGTIESLAQACHSALRSMIYHCRTATESIQSPSDFELVSLQASELDRILAMVAFETGGVR